MKKILIGFFILLFAGVYANPSDRIRGAQNKVIRLAIAALEDSAAYLALDNTFTGQVILSNTTDASSLTTGSLYTTGGLAVAKQLFLGDDLDMSVSGTGTYDITLKDAVADALSIVRGTTDMIVFNTSTPLITITPATTITGAVTSSGLVTGAGFANTLNGATLTSSADSLTATNRTGVVYTSTFTFTDRCIVMTDAAAAGCHGTLKLIDFPEGYIKIVGAVLSLAATAGSGGIVDAATYDVGLGQAQLGIDNDALAGTEQDILNKIEGDMTSGAATLLSATGTDLLIDGHTSAADCYLNVAIEQDDASANDIIDFTGSVVITWVYLGDG